MYNEELKKEWIESVEVKNKLLPKVLGFLFASTEKRERELDQDVSEWSAAEIIRSYKLLLTASIHQLEMRHDYLKRYSTWCGDRHLLKDNQNHYTEIDITVLKSCLYTGWRNKGIMTRKEMETAIKDLLNPRDKCLVYALFEGIRGINFSELYNLNVKQVKDNSLQLEKRTVPVSKKLINLIYESSEEYTYYAYGEFERKLKFPADDDNVFKKSLNSSDSTPEKKRQRLYSNLDRIRKFLDNPAIEAKTLIESGRIDMIKTLCEEENGIDIREVIKKHKKEIENKYGRIPSIHRYMLNWGEYYKEG